MCVGATLPMTYRQQDGAGVRGSCSDRFEQLRLYCPANNIPRHKWHVCAQGLR